MSGECSEDAISLLLQQESYKQKVLRRLLDNHLITRKQKDGLKGYRLMYNGKRILLQMSEETFSFYLADGADFPMRKSTLTQRVRQHRISEILAMMEKADIILARNKKLPLFEKEMTQADDLSQSFFYHPREVKVQPDLTRKIISSKMTGVWLSDDAVWLTYNIGQQLPTWFENVENRAEALVRSMLREKGLEYDDVGVAMFGQSIEQAMECLNDPKMCRYILNAPFSRFCYVPLDEKGVFLMKLLRDSDKLNNLKAILAEDLSQGNKHRWINHDGYNPDGLPTLICIDGDLKRLIRFITQLQYQGLQGEVICFDFQKEAIKEYCGEKTKISTVDREAVRKTFFSGE